MLNALRFTLLEAGLSAFCSVVIGAWLAHIWVRMNWRGKSLWEAVIFLPFFMPTLFIVLAVVRFFGRKFLGLDIYGLNGIVIAHVLLNAPLVFYLILASWRGVASESLMIAQNLGQVSRLVERPLLRRVLPPAFGLVFLYASLSFTIVLILGGGPGKNTLELAIYDAIRNRFDLKYAFLLAAMQAILGFTLYIFISKEIRADIPALGRVPDLAMDVPFWRKILYIVSLIACLMLLVLPLLIVFLNGIWNLPELMASMDGRVFARALWNSLWLAFVFGVLVNIFAIWIVRKNWDGATWLIAAISPLVIATFFFLIIRPFVNPFSLGLPFIVFVQVLVASPVFVRIWRQALDMISPEEKMLIETVETSKWSQFKILYFPRLKGQGFRALAIAVALSIGDLALYPLMAPAGFVNLPILIWQMMSSYRFDGAMALGSLMILLVSIILARGVYAAWRIEKNYA